MGAAVVLAGLTGLKSCPPTRCLALWLLTLLLALVVLAQPFGVGRWRCDMPGECGHATDASASKRVPGPCHLSP